MPQAVAHQAFGLTLSSDFELPGLRSSDSSGPRLSIHLVEPGELAARAGSGPGRVLWTTVMDDAQAVLLERRPEGGHRYQYGARAEFLLLPEGTILCAPDEPSEPSWKRFLLDTVLFTTSLLHGFEALHGSSVEVEAGVLVFLASTGGGKTSLAYELICRGGALFCDDVLALGRGTSGVVAHPGPALMNVPASARTGQGAQPAGRLLATLGDELWLEIASPPASPRTPAAVFLLDRGGRTGSGIRRLDPSPLPLLAHALGLDSGDGRARAKFELIADLVEGTPLYSIEASPAVTPEELADLVEQALEPSRDALARVGA